MSNVSYSQISHIIHEIEERFPISEWEIEGIKVWPIIRIELAMVFRETYYHQTPKAIKNKIVTKKFGNNIRWNSKNEIIIFGTTIGKAKVADEFVNQYIKPIEENLSNNFKTLIVERAKKGNIDGTTPLNTLIISYPKWNWLFALAQLKSIILKGKITLKRYDEFLKYIEKYNINSSKLNKRKIFLKFLKFKSYVALYSLFLTIAKPSIVIVQCFYSLDSMAICHVANLKGILTFDIQHGVQGDFHYAYSNWKKEIINSFSILPKGFLVWNQDAKANLIRNNLGGDKIFNIGNLWHDYCITKYKKLSLQLQYFDTKKYEFKILITIQDYIPNEWILALIKEHQNCFWFIRLHPQHIHLKKLILERIGLINNFEIESLSQLPLPFLLNHVDFHVTGSSSVVIEAYSFGLKTIVTDPIGVSYYAPLINEGFVFPALNSREFYTCLKNENLHKSNIENALNELDNFKNFIQNRLISGMENKGSI